MHAYISANGQYCNTILKQINGLDPESAATEFQVFPNPTSGIVRIRSRKALNGPGEVRVYSIYGNFVRTCPLNASGPGTLTLTGIPSGAYVLTIRAGDSVHTCKLIKQ